MSKQKERVVFGLDIGTRSIVGTVGYRVGTDRFVVVAQVSKEHNTRAVIDGQIHDIPAVTDRIIEVKMKLEELTGEKLEDVSIAAAGRVLKTKTVFVEYEMPSETRVTKGHLQSLDNLAVERAYDEVKKEADHKDKHFYCVGYSPVKYYLNGYPMEMLEQHMAASIGVEMIATFLPDEVVDGLYAAVEGAGLKVASLTLEPIAAINLAIPERFRLLNIAMVDVGAGTSDISIVKDGSVIAFGMMPLAGDEITEAIAKRYLVDFEDAERIKRAGTSKKTISFKNVMGETVKLTKEEIQATALEAINGIVDKLSEKIIELNGGNPVSAVFVVGGGAKMPGFTERMAEMLGLPENRVALRGAEVLQQVDFSGTGIKKDSTLVTPIGICMEYYEQKSEFIHVRVNEERVKIYDNGKATVLDACMHAGYSQSNLFPSRGEGFTYTVNGTEREVKGRMGEAAEVLRNGVESNLNELIQAEDVIQVKPATKGEDGVQLLGKVLECRRKMKFKVFGHTVTCPVRAEVNREEQPPDYPLKQGDSVRVYNTYTVRQLFAFLDLPEENKVLVNGHVRDRSSEIKEGDVIEKVRKEKPKRTQNTQNTRNGPVTERPATVLSEMGSLASPPGGDPLLSPAKPLPDWATGLPIRNSAGQMLTPGDAGNAAFGSAAGNVSYGSAVGNAAYGGGAYMPDTGAQSAPMGAGASGSQVTVEVNGKRVSLLPKPNHMFVDVFDVYPFDLTKPGGKRMVSRLNGMDVSDFTVPVKDGDHIDLYWEK